MHSYNQILHSFSLKDIPKFAPNSESIQMPLQISRIRASATSQDLKVCKYASFWLPWCLPVQPGKFEIIFLWAALLLSLFLTRPWSPTFRSLAPVNLSRLMPYGFSKLSPSCAKLYQFVLSSDKNPLLAPYFCTCCSSWLKCSPPSLVKLFLNVLLCKTEVFLSSSSDYCSQDTVHRWITAPISLTQRSHLHVCPPPPLAPTHTGPVDSLRKRSVHSLLLHSFAPSQYLARHQVVNEWTAAS